LSDEIVAITSDKERVQVRGALALGECLLDHELAGLAVIAFDKTSV
jgi:hypothetical protein